MYNFKNKDENIRQNNAYMFAKTVSMFEWTGLPETIPYRELEKILQTIGFAFITEVEGKLYALKGNLGGEQDAYGNPKKITITNVGLNFNKTLDVENDGVLIRSDDSLMGLLPLFNKYHFMMVENDINMVMRGYNSRIQALISAGDDKTRASAEKYLDKIVAGDLGVIGESELFDGLRLQSVATGQGSTITPMVEFQQYMRGTLYNEIGLNANFNMKRERVTNGEMDANDDALYPFVDNMMQCRLTAIAAINEKYGTEIDIDYGSVWYKKNKELVDGVIENEPIAETSGETANQNGGAIDEPKDDSTDGENEEVVNEINEGENEQQLENDSNGIDNGDSTDNREGKTIADIQEILLDETLSEEERLEWETLLAELLEGEQDATK